MRRRTALRALTGTLVGAVAGCSIPPGAGGDGTGDADWRGLTTPARARAAVQAPIDLGLFEDDPASVTRVGSRPTANADNWLPWDVHVWNDHEDGRSIEVAVYGESGGRAVDRTVTLPPGAYREFRLLRPDRYAVQVRADDRQRYEFTLERTDFDCNDHWAILRVTSTGLVEYATGGTAVACG